jgi:RNA polymerase sigma factor (sigma-70 family)
VPRDLPPYLQDLYRTPLLSAARERALFLKFNFHKFQFAAARRRLDPQFARAGDLNQLEALLRRTTEVKNQIVRANLRLVVSIARKHLRNGLSLMELISDGNITLMRAVEGFDTHKGNRFSTYATLALMKGFARSVPQTIAASRRSASVDHDTLAGIADHRSRSVTHRFAERDEIRQLLGQLDPREREVLSACYGLSSESSRPATHDEIAQDLGLTKHRVRQIERTALAKLRDLASR